MSDAAFWDKIADKYASDPIADQAGYDYTLNRMKSVLTLSDKVFELGAGTGTTAIELAPGVARYLATDISTRMMEIGRQKAEAAGVQNLDFEATTSDDSAFQGAGFDAVLGLNFLHLVPDVERTLAQIHGMLRPGGLLIVKTACLRNAKLVPRILMSAMIPVLALIGKAPSNVQKLSIAQHDALLKVAGFDIEESYTQPGTPPRQFVVARRR